MATFSDRLKELSAEMGRGWQADLARACGVKAPSVADWVSGKTKTLEGANLLNAAAFFGVRPGWLESGKGRKWDADSPYALAGKATALIASEGSPQSEMFGTGVIIPVMSAAASMGAGAEQHDDVVVGRITVSPNWVAKTLKPLTKMENLRFIHGYGDSMEPTFSDGDILLVDVGVRSANVDGIYVLEANQRLFIKRVTERFDGVHEITSDNPRVKTVQALDGSQNVDILGRVVWAWNGKKL